MRIRKPKGAPWRRRRVIARTRYRPALNVRGSLWRLEFECGHTVERKGGENGATLQRVECHRCQFAGEFR